jgi:L-fucose mutarotase/ribose pyranase (RbsD/FucU family)
MKTTKKLATPLAICCLLGASGASAVHSAPRKSASANATWRQTLASRLPLYGHRNWIVIVDSAYPAQSSAGIETVVANAGQAEVVREVLASLKQQKHVRPIVYTDAELRYVPERDAPGIGAYRKSLNAVLGARPVQSLPHEQIISKLDEAGKTFRVLLIKTNMTLPYTSVFLQLDCGYWGPDAEKRLRAAMPK